MWRTSFTKSFLRAAKKLDDRRKTQTKEAIKSFLYYMESLQKSHGLGLKRMKGKIWEIRVNIADRILFEMDDRYQIVEFLMVGNHDEIRRFLKRR